MSRKMCTLLDANDPGGEYIFYCCDNFIPTGDFLARKHRLKYVILIANVIYGQNCTTVSHFTLAIRCNSQLICLSQICSKKIHEEIPTHRLLVLVLVLELHRGEPRKFPISINLNLREL